MYDKKSVFGIIALLFENNFKNQRNEQASMCAYCRIYGTFIWQLSRLMQSSVVALTQSTYSNCKENVIFFGICGQTEHVETFCHLFPLKL